MESEEGYQIEYFEQAKKDYKSLDGSQKVIVDKAINKIKIYGMNCGENLHGDLVGCKKLKHRKAGLRIVFRSHAESVQIIEIVSIGKRDNLEVYSVASHRISQVRMKTKPKTIKKHRVYSRSQVNSKKRKNHMD
ncbi:MAG: type II toxin-antitoxin system RelE family toxin [Lactobacillaceae bacterium]